MFDRVCARCGMGTGGIWPHPMIVIWAKEKGVELKRPDSTNLHHRCVRRLRFEITRKIKEGK